MSSSELLRRLQAAEAALATMAPGPHLEARIRARALDQRAAGLPWVLVGARRLHRPLILAFAAAAAAAMLAMGGGRGSAGSSALAGGPEDPADHIVNDRAHADGGPREAASGEHSTAPRPVFHVPALDPRFDGGDLPAPRQSPLTPLPVTAPSSLGPLPFTPASLRDELDDRGRRSGRVEVWRPAVASVGRAAGPTSSPAASTWRPSFVARGGGEITTRDASSSTSHGGDGPVAAVDCKSPSALRDIAAAKCEATGVALSTFTFLEPCGGGQFGSISFQCVGPEPDVKPDPKPEPEDQCVQESFDGGATCVDLGGHDKDPLAGIQKQATVACAQLGLLLSELAVDAAGCAPESGKVTYVCCPMAAPTPAPETCHDDKVGAATCVDLAILEAKASTLCAQSGQKLAMISPLAGCSDGQASTATISCCPTSP
ncbi:MAG: hypothetical protein ABJE95_37930 [Byssovorax sp.]